MLSQSILDILNRQVEREAYSSHIYLSMASWAETVGYKGIAEWLYHQSEEERKHMLKLISYINDRGSKSVIPALNKPPVEFPSVLELFEEVLKHERFISASINEIVDLVVREKDHTTNNFIQWYVKEQIEEESSVKAILDQLKMLGSGSLFYFDRHIMKLREE